MRIPPVNQTVMEGEKGRLECKSKDPEARVTWFKDGVPLSQVGGDLSSRVWVGQEGSLTITHAAAGDPGMYTCQITGKQGEIQSASAFFDVQYKARVLKTAKEVFLPFGRPGLLDCKSSANPPITKLRWEKDGFLFDPYNVQGVFLRRNGSLYFSKVEESHAGEYTCTPYNGLGTSGPSPAINVVVQHPPVFTLTPHNLYLRKIGDTIQMPCEALDGDDSHQPTIIWFKKDGSPLPADRSIISGGNLTITNIRETDKGLYQCVASNEAATISTDTELLIENSLPRAPYNLSGNATDNSVKIIWKPGYGVSSHQLSVWYRAADSIEWRTVRASGTEAVVRSLDPGKEYEFMVVSQDTNGDGMFSKPIRVHTIGPALEGSNGTQESFSIATGIEQSIGPPKNLRVVLDLEGYILHWDPPSFGQDLLEHYKVLWVEGPLDFEESGKSMEVVETKETSYIVGELNDDSSYHFQVKAVARNNYATSDVFIVHIPSLKKSQSLSLFIAGSIGFIIAVIIMCIYSHRLNVRTHIQSLRSARQ